MDSLKVSAFAVAVVVSLAPCPITAQSSNAVNRSTSVSSKASGGQPSARANAPARVADREIGHIVSIRYPTFIRYSTDVSFDGIEADATSTRLPMVVMDKSKVTLRLKVVDGGQTYWVNPAEVEFDGAINDQPPIYVDHKPQAGVRGID